MITCPKCGYIDKKRLKKLEEDMEHSNKKVKVIMHNLKIHEARIQIGLGHASKEQYELSKKKLVNIDEI